MTIYSCPESIQRKAADRSTAVPMSARSPGRDLLVADDLFAADDREGPPIDSRRL